MPIVPLYGHHALRTRLKDALDRGVLPQSLLLHGDTGIGKQRLALWLAAALTCEREARPCGECRHCRMVNTLAHPDVMWVFPRPRLKDSDASADEVKSDLITAGLERAKANGLYAAPSGTEGIYVPTIRTVVRQASITPAMAKRKVVIIGDAERMVSQEGSDQAANAFLKLLEEPFANTWIILTCSVPGALLPTIRSRVINVRVAPLSHDDVRQWLADPLVHEALKEESLPKSDEQRADLAAGAPGRLIGATDSATVFDAARRFIDVARSGDQERAAKLALSHGVSGARGGFSDLLDAIEAELRNRMRVALGEGDEGLARGAAQAVETIEDAKQLAYNNVNPQLIAWSVVTSLGESLGKGRGP
ncbi:MAG: hypothetical protein H7066_03140 [Cytophagaceae bacterium]|nr:hypothetical protein [Gemmatimonadaceae bacterium]